MNLPASTVWQLFLEDVSTRRTLVLWLRMLGAQGAYVPYQRSGVKCSTTDDVPNGLCFRSCVYVYNAELGGLLIGMREA